jgi:hypothetical protein
MSKLLAAILLTLGTSAYADTLIYDTFNEQDPAHLFDCCNALRLTTRHTDEGVRRYAIPFTAPKTGHIQEVDVAAFEESPHSEVLGVAIRVDSDGLPGETLQHWKTDSPPPGHCCFFVKLHSPKPGAQVIEGKVYWLEVKTIGHHEAGEWNFNSLGLSGDYATLGPDMMWQLTSGPLPAARIYLKR